MSERNFKSLEGWAKGSVSAMGTDSRNLVRSFTEIIIRDLGRDAIAKTPRGPDAAAQARVRRGGGSAYGHMADNWILVSRSGSVTPVTGGSVSIDLIRQTVGRKLTRSTRATPVGTKAKLANRAAHARVIEMGRQKSGPIPRRGGSPRWKGTHTRTIGSPQAPRGVLRPAIDRLTARVNRVKSDAIKKTERGL